MAQGVLGSLYSGRNEMINHQTSRELIMTQVTYFESRNSRRNILPTLLFGNSVRNSICRGNL